MPGVDVRMGENTSCTRNLVVAADGTVYRQSDRSAVAAGPDCLDHQPKHRPPFKTAAHYPRVYHLFFRLFSDLRTGGLVGKAVSNWQWTLRYAYSVNGLKALASLLQVSII